MRDGAGQSPAAERRRISGLRRLYDVVQAKNCSTHNTITLASTFGKPEEVCDGFDFDANARLPKGAIVSGGVSMGRTRTNNCYAISDPTISLASADLTGTLGAAAATSVGPFAITAPKTNAFCDVRPPFQPNVKLLAVYPLPWWGIQTSLTYQGLPGQMITASRTYTNAEILPSLQRNLAAGANSTVVIDLIPPGTMYGARMNQVDFRVAKTFSAGHGRIQAKMDVYNLLNTAAVLGLNTTYGTAWLRPTQILLTRLVRVGVDITF